MKRLITEPTLQIEPKGRDVVEEPNRLHVMLASNNEWVVPAGVHERRYAVQEVADIHRQDPNWFEPIYQEMRSGGLEAMLYDLLRYDLGSWHPRQIVRTQALAKQQEESLSPLDQWWLELLQTAVLQGASEHAPDEAVSNEYEEERNRRLWRQAHAHGEAQGLVRSGSAHLAEAQGRQRYRPWSLSPSARSRVYERMAAAWWPWSPRLEIPATEAMP